MFAIAEKLSKTVHELMTGETAPLTAHEYNYWLAYFKISADEEKNSRKNQMQDKKERLEQQAERRTIGNG